MIAASVERILETAGAHPKPAHEGTQMNDSKVEPSRPKRPKTGGRVAGTPNKATAEVKRAAQAYTEQALRTLGAILSNEDMPAAARVAACREILDRGHGKPMQAVEISAPEDSRAERLARARARAR